MIAGARRGYAMSGSMSRSIPLTADFLADPYAVLADLPRDEQPVFFAPSIGYYVLTRYADIAEVFCDPATYSAAVAQAPLVPVVPEAQRILLAGGNKPQPTMVSLDEPEHGRLRKPTARAFSMKRVTALIPVIEATTARLLDAVGPAARLRPGGRPRLPAARQYRLLPDGRARTGLRADQALECHGQPPDGAAPAPEDQVEIATGMTAYRAYLRELVDAKAGEPGDDLTSDLLAIHDEDPERLTQADVSSILYSLSFAGHETTTGLIGNTVRRLLEVPDRWDDVVRDPALILAAVEETLRYDPSVPLPLAAGHHLAGHAGFKVNLPAGARSLPVASSRGAGRRGLQPAGRIRRTLFRLRSPPGLRQGPALSPGREPREAGNSDRASALASRGPRLRLVTGSAAHLPPQHLFPRTAGPDGAHA